jgi:hypothetical protein
MVYWAAHKDTDTVKMTPGLMGFYVMRDGFLVAGVWVVGLMTAIQSLQL